MTVTVRGNNAAIFKAVNEVVKSRLLVGIPDSAAARPAVAGEKNPPSNALMGYVMEFGSPEKNIPASSFLVPGVEDVSKPRRPGPAQEYAERGNVRRCRAITYAVRGRE